MPAESPCVEVCELDGETCVACGRTIEEIAAWGTMTDAERQDVLDRLEADRS